MTIYSLYIFDRHCNCVYYQDWHRTKRPRPAAKDGLLPGVSHAVSPQPTSSESRRDSGFTNPRNTLSSNSGIIVAVNDDVPITPSGATSPANSIPPPSGLPFDEEAKLVYGVILSLRNMMKKLSKREEQFTSYRTSTYKMHLYETVSGYKFVMLTDPRIDSVRFVLRQLYTGPFMEYVVRNPLITMDSREYGIDNEYFRASMDRVVRGLSIFQ